MSNQVTFSIALTESNLALINAVQAMIISGDVDAKPESTTSSKASSTKATGGKASSTKTEKSDAEISLDEMKKVVKAAKAEHGEDFCKECIAGVGGKDNVALGRCLSSVDESEYENLKVLLEAGPEEEGEEEEDDGLGDDDGVEVDVESVKAALRAYSKENGRDEAKALMKKFGAASLTQVDKLDQDDLRGLMDEMV